MSARQLLEALASQGLELWGDGDNLRYKGPKKALTPDVLAELKARKPEILLALDSGLEASRRSEGSSKGRRLPPKVDGVYVHGDECDCDWCEEDAALIRTGIIQSERQVFELAREHFGLNSKREEGKT